MMKLFKYYYHYRLLLLIISVTAYALFYLFFHDYMKNVILTTSVAMVFGMLVGYFDIKEIFKKQKGNQICLAESDYSGALIGIYFLSETPASLAMLVLVYKYMLYSWFLAILGSIVGINFIFLIKTYLFESKNGILTVRTFPNNNYSGIHKLVDQKAKVIKNLDPIGKVKYGEEIWNATSENGDLLIEGTSVIVVDNQGMTLIVRGDK